MRGLGCGEPVSPPPTGAREHTQPTLNKISVDMHIERFDQMHQKIPTVQRELETLSKLLDHGGLDRRQHTKHSLAITNVLHPTAAGAGCWSEAWHGFGDSNNGPARLLVSMSAFLNIKPMRTRMNSRREASSFDAKVLVSDRRCHNEPKLRGRRISRWRAEATLSPPRPHELVISMVMGEAQQVVTWHNKGNWCVHGQPQPTSSRSSKTLGPYCKHSKPARKYKKPKGPNRESQGLITQTKENADRGNIQAKTNQTPLTRQIAETNLLPFLCARKSAARSAPQTRWTRKNAPRRGKNFCGLGVETHT